MFVKYLDDSGMAIIELKSVSIYEHGVRGGVNQWFLYANRNDYIRSVLEDTARRIASLLTTPEDYSNRMGFYEQADLHRYYSSSAIDDLDKEELDKAFICSIACFATREDANDAVTALYEAMERGDKVFDMCKYEGDVWEKIEQRKNSQNEEESSNANG